MGAGLFFIFSLIVFVGFGILFLFFKLPNTFSSNSIKYKKTKNFTPLEKQIIQQYIEKKDENEKSLMDKQIAIFNTKHRFYNKRKLLVEFRSEDNEHLPQSLLLNDKRISRSEIMTFRINKTDFESYLTFKNGRISELTIIPNPKKYERNHNAVFT
ncbi:hypothetical protein E1176_09470 [Fulvivirga sp. RKSG066]|nr:hypothetical protein [Fulvivirga aurantia]